MRPIPAQRISHAHGLLKALDQRGKLRLEEFVTEFNEADLFPPDLENEAGRTRQLVSYARAAGLVKEERGTVELTDLGKRYVKSADRRDTFRVSPGQAEWLRRQLREKHLTESIWNGAAIALSLYSSLPDGEWVALIDVGRAAAHLGRAGWDNDATFATQGERLTNLLEDMELVDAERGLTDIGRETIGELRLPIHAGLLELAAQLNPGGAEGAAAAAAAEREALGLGAAPAAESAVAAADPPPEEAIEGPDDEAAEGTGQWVEVGPAAAAAAGAAESTPAPVEPEPVEAPAAEAAAEPEPVEAAAAEAAAPDTPSQPAPGPIEAAALAAAAGEEIAGPDDPTRTYATPPATGAAAGVAGSGNAEDAAPAITTAASKPPPGVSAPPPPPPPPTEAEAPAVEPGEPLAPPVPASEAPQAETPEPGEPLAEPEPAGAPEAEVPVDGEPVGVAAAAAAAAQAENENQVGETEETAMTAPGGPTDPQPPAPAAAPPPPPPPPPATEPGAPDSGSFQSGIRPTTAITAIKPEDLANWKATQEAVEAEGKKKDKTKGDGGPFLDPAEVRAAAERRGLVIDPGVYAAAIAALASGRHLVLTGGAGSGKTALALAIAEAAVRQDRCKSILFTSAGSGLRSGDVLGRRNRDSGDFTPGLVPTAIANDQWLVIDELDRVRLDRALGGVSTVLGGQPIDLPGGGELGPPSGWRMIATMATIDQVGETTAALRRRFVFVEVPVLERQDLETLVEAWAGDDAVAAAVGKRLVAINDVIPLGPGLYKDAIAYVKQRRTLADAAESDLIIEALAGFVLPQLEGAGDEVAAQAVQAAGLGG